MSNKTELKRKELYKKLAECWRAEGEINAELINLLDEDEDEERKDLRKQLIRLLDSRIKTATAIQDKVEHLWYDFEFLVEISKQAYQIQEKLNGGPLHVPLEHSIICEDHLATSLKILMHQCGFREPKGHNINQDHDYRNMPSFAERTAEGNEEILRRFRYGAGGEFTDM